MAQSYQDSLDFYCYETTLPPASVRAFAVFAGPIPPELTADTSMMYIV